MATVISATVVFLVTWLLFWALLMAGYLALAALVEYLRGQWRQHQRVRQYRQAAAAELARMDLETFASVQRLGMAFMVAQRLVRQEARRDSQSSRPAA